MRRRPSAAKRLLSAVLALGVAGGAVAARGAELRLGGKLLLTEGVSSVEGASGGGLATWAVIAGDETRDGVGLAVHATDVRLRDFELQSAGLAVGLFDRVEVSYARQRFDTAAAGVKLGLGRGFTFDQDVAGMKLRLLGNLVYDQDSWLPQVAIGAQYKHNDRPAVVRAVGASSAEGVDYYIAATKLILAQSLLVDTTVRWTRANQTGLLGFGGPRGREATPQFEGSLAYLLTRRLAIGAEVRSKPDGLAFAREDAAGDVFAAFAFNPSLSATLAYVDLGDIAGFSRQRGLFLSLQSGF